MFYLINKNTKEIADVVAFTLEDAQKVASKYLGGEPIKWVERFQNDYAEFQKRKHGRKFYNIMI